MVHLHAGLSIDHHGREGDADPSRHAADVVVGVDDDRAEQQLDLQRSAERPDAARRADRAGSRSRPPAGRKASSTQSRPISSTPPPTTCSTRAAATSWRSTPGRRAVFCPAAYNYYAVSADARHYLPIGESIVIANRMQVGNIDQAGEDPANVPFSKKYFLGGASSIRGWGRYEISPLSGSGYPIGGNTTFAFSSELRAVLRGNLGGVLFFDAGNVWTDRWAIKFDDLRYAVGPGLRYQTPVGPVRFDFGWQINPIPDLLVNGKPQSRRWRMHFSIGQAF